MRGSDRTLAHGPVAAPRSRREPWRRRARAAALGIAAVLIGTTAEAQFGQRFPGFVNLPDQDFTWNWGRAVDDTRARRVEDFSVRGGQARFRCTLTGRFRPGSRYSPADIRALERRLGASLVFIEDAAYTMNDLDLRREIDWATLACAEPVADDSEQASREREERARAKALRELEKRRARREREQARDAD